MKKILVTGGTVFVSRAVAEYFVAKGQDVYVLNRNSRTQSKGVTLIQADRHDLGEILRPYHFDAVIDTAYTSQDVAQLLDALGGCDEYILISSSAVYPETGRQPFTENEPLGVNRFWGKYGTDKIEAEATLQKRKPGAYILRPPYLYGPMNDVYREALVFDCALQDRPFCLPGDGEMKLQFFHVHDLCRFIDVILQKKPEQHIFNVGNPHTVSVREWVALCYQVVGKQARFVNVPKEIEQRKYFCFSDYEYALDVSGQCEWMKDTRDLQDGLREAFVWYEQHADEVERRPYIAYMEEHLKGCSLPDV
ncbi:MAG: NAD-dependent epimerase/dehydratase family protein [Lachnospiraceae bacterium]|nr:NAD-dependent epimerase/dehydratase family protein [Lachnospiraceae bacterium]